VPGDDPEVFVLEGDPEVFVLEGAEPEVIILEGDVEPEVIEVSIAGPQGPPGVGLLVREPLIGDIDGSNRTFLTSAPYKPGTTQPFWNGLLQAPGEDADYTETAADEVTFSVSAVPESGDTVSIVYVKEST
jgi:hypothetical protein